MKIETKERSLQSPSLFGVVIDSLTQTWRGWEDMETARALVGVCLKLVRLQCWNWGLQKTTGRLKVDDIDERE